MKKGPMILLSICVMSICIVFGIFIGRNLPGHYVRLHQRVIEEQQVISDTAESTQIKDGTIDLNTATQAQFEELPGIGEVLAQRIVDYRQMHGPFVVIEDLLNVEGIGKKKLEQLEPFVRIGG